MLQSVCGCELILPKPRSQAVTSRQSVSCSLRLLIQSHNSWAFCCVSQALRPNDVWLAVAAPVGHALWGSYGVPAGCQSHGSRRLAAEQFINLDTKECILALCIFSEGCIK